MAPKTLLLAAPLLLAAGVPNTPPGDAAAPNPELAAGVPKADGCPNPAAVLLLEPNTPLVAAG